MTLSDVSIKNPVFAWMLMACTMLFGIVAMCMIAALIPMLRIIRLDPAMVFKG